VESGAAAAIAGERRSPEAARGDGVDQSQTLSQSVSQPGKGTTVPGWRAYLSGRAPRGACRGVGSVGAGGGRASPGLGARGGVGGGATGLWRVSREPESWSGLLDWNWWVGWLTGWFV
jgi:hypothetical protein